MPAAGPLATAARPPSCQCPLIAAVRCSHLPAMHRCLLAVTRETNQNYFFSRINPNKKLGFLNTWFSSPILLCLLKTKCLSFPHFFALFLSGFRNPSKCLVFFRLFTFDMKIKWIYLLFSLNVVLDINWWTNIISSVRSASYYKF